MDWNIIIAVTVVCGTVLILVSILVVIGIERQKNILNQNKPVKERYGLNDTSHDPYEPYLRISVGLIGACGGVLSILVPWRLSNASSEWQCLLYPFLITGLIGGVIGALCYDWLYMNWFFNADSHMARKIPYLRFPVSAISGVLGGWLALPLIINGFLYKMATGDEPW